ncbi:3-methyladenine DNA glycosylase [Blastococcus sp. VKM Ac-2987]|uniref:3-methyladenine DNA glycosylase n=1 Tax=Blastococcus sp. VKM Ac-2987 TaxID=3004141 RepID=UPI0022AB5293|nr:3-methyladenine DNA glycosylase [Blastococcus sp. VKM Ac-2987]MCZ2859072.1 3-methyladenine DNA glycosylase [Blastococcus sp. VKM Ac-2987]
MPRPPLTVLDEGQWLPRARAHAARMAVWTGPHAARRRAGVAHPVLDFLFTYYSETPGRLARWHPGVGFALAGPAARERLDWPFHTARADGAVGIDPAAFLAARGEVVARVAHLLRATAGRPAQFGCFGLHEWAMVYRPDDGEVRHGVPLRLGIDGTAEVVDRHRVQCSHFDAYRFFSRRGRPLNTLRPTRAAQPDLEQPGCLHATMDLYKWAYKLSPAVPGELLADCFALAVDVRELDMRASPYDLSGHGYDPVPVETPEGKAQYVAAQRAFADRGATLRRRLVDVCETVLGAGPFVTPRP